MFVLGSSFFTLLPVRLIGVSKCRSVPSESPVRIVLHDPYLDIEILLPPLINKTAPIFIGTVPCSSPPVPIIYLDFSFSFVYGAGVCLSRRAQRADLYKTSTRHGAKGRKEGFFMDSFIITKTYYVEFGAQKLTYLVIDLLSVFCYNINRSWLYNIL